MEGNDVIRTAVAVRGSHRRCSKNKGVLINSAKSTGKELSLSLLCSKVAG